ncbi:unnamed protein product, partial [marine sediment metagenome]
MGTKSNMNWYKTSQEFEDIPAACKAGDCFEAAGRYVMDNALMGNNQNLLLVHGEVTGQGQLKGIKYGHAWIEKGNEIIDVSKG